MSIQIYHSEHYFADLGKHVMPIRKFALVRAAIESEFRDVRIEAPEPVTDLDLLRVHTPDYIRAIATGQPKELAESQKFPWSAALAESVLHTNGGCIAALRTALKEGIAGNIASGFHHSHRTRGEGYCTFNGLVVAMERLRAETHPTLRTLVIDMDLHYGNGTASLLAERPWAHQLSIYGNFYKNNLAVRDVTLERAPDTDNCFSLPVLEHSNGETYLKILRDSLPAAIERARPDVILFQAGADPYREDPYSPLDLTHADLRARDTYVFETCKARKIPVMWVLAGGYTPDISKVVEVHVNTYRAAMDVYRT
jgi:acetoin utilization deacetylase AcuC-like enzyme